jgi:hypothetical protein
VEKRRMNCDASIICGFIEACRTFSSRGSYG